MKHTPGPWKINHWKHAEKETRYFDGVFNGINMWYGHLSGCSEFILISGPREDIGKTPLFADHQGPHICDISWGGPARQEAEETAVANARLIAAAPDLLAQCKDALNYVSGRPENWAIGLAENLRKAIAKAEGGDA